MKRLALVLAAAVLGTGCVVSPANGPPPGTLDLAWSFVRTLNNATATQVTYGCVQAGIDTVVVDTGVGAMTLPCRDAAGDGGAVGLDAGTYNIVVTAYRGGVALYSAPFNGVSIAPNATTSINPARLNAIYAPLQINIAFQAGSTVWNTCYGAGVTAYYVDLYDYAGTLVYGSPSIPCSDPPGPSLIFDSTSSVGPVDLDAYRVRVVASGAVFRYDDQVSPTCSSPVFNHYGSNVSTNAWTVTAYDAAGPTCPFP